MSSSSKTSLVDSFKLRALKALPKNLASRAFGAVSEVELPRPVQGIVNTGFARLYDLDVDEAERPPSDYPSLNAFFTRRLREGARDVERIDEIGGRGLWSPVDGRITQYGSLDRGVLMQAKGREYTLVDLVDSAAQAEVFEEGHWMTIYLSPRDYHRIHSPVAGTVRQISYIPGHLWPVNPLSVRHIERLFTINERLITYVDTEQMGRVAVIKVGATCVGRISLAFDPLQSNSGFRRRQEIELAQPVEVGAGEELAVFNLGSTVILLIEEPDFAFDEDLIDGQSVKMGTRLGARP